MPKGSNLNFDHQSRASQKKWQQMSDTDKADQLARLALSLLKKAESLRAQALFAASDVEGGETG